MDNDTGQVVKMVEKYIISAIGILSIAVMLWVGNSVTESRESIVALQIETRNVINLVGDLKAEVREMRADRYTKTDSIRDVDDVNRRITDLTSRLERIEKKVYP